MTWCSATRAASRSCGSWHGRQRARRVQGRPQRSEEHTSELQSHVNLVCRLLLEKKKEEPGARVDRAHQLNLFHQLTALVSAGRSVVVGLHGLWFERRWCHRCVLMVACCRLVACA